MDVEEKERISIGLLWTRWWRIMMGRNRSVILRIWCGLSVIPQPMNEFEGTDSMSISEVMSRGSV